MYKIKPILTILNLYNRNNNLTKTVSGSIIYLKHLDH